MSYKSQYLIQFNNPSDTMPTEMQRLADKLSSIFEKTHTSEYIRMDGPPFDYNVKTNIIAVSGEYTYRYADETIQTLIQLHPETAPFTVTIYGEELGTLSSFHYENGAESKTDKIIYIPLL